MYSIQTAISHETYNNAYDSPFIFQTDNRTVVVTSFPSVASLSQFPLSGCRCELGWIHFTFSMGKMTGVTELESSSNLIDGLLHPFPSHLYTPPPQTLV